MRRIDRQAVIANGRAVAALVDGPHALMAIPAERAQRPETELIVIAAMPRVMIGDGGRSDAALFLAQGAERLDLKLVARARSPALQIVPGTPRKRLRRGEITRVHLAAKVRPVGGLDKRPSGWGTVGTQSFPVLLAFSLCRAREVLRPPNRVCVLASSPCKPLI